MSVSRRIAATALAGLALGAAPSAVRAADDWQIGYISATSGPLKASGDPSAVAVEMAVAEINAKGGIKGRQIHLTHYDTASEPKQASVAVRALAQDAKVLAIVGPLSSGETAVAMNDAERAGVLMLPYSATTPRLTEGMTFTWRLAAMEDKQFTRLLKTLQRHSIAMKSAEIIYVSDERVSNVAGTESYPAIFKTFGIQHGSPIAVNFKSFDVSAQVAQAIQRSPDLIAVAGTYDPASRILRELARQGYKGQVIGSQIFADPNIVELLGDDVNGTLFVSGFWRDRTDATKAFTQHFIDETGKRGIHKLGAHHADAQAYDTVYLLKQIIEKSGVTGDPAKLVEERIAVRDALKGMRFSGVLGDGICFNGSDAELPAYIIQVKGGRWTKFDEWPADACTKG